MTTAHTQPLNPYAVADLYNALSALVAATEVAGPTLCGFCMRHHTKHGRDCPVVSARAALAKARGEQTAKEAKQ